MLAEAAHNAKDGALKSFRISDKDRYELETAAWLHDCGKVVTPEYAGGHHEKMDGTGYPRGLRREEMSVQARIMTIADMFEALTARDRPYKKGKKLSDCLKIMGFMKTQGHIDPDIFEIFIKQRVYMDYAKEFLDQDQIDEALIPGYAASA